MSGVRIGYHCSHEQLPPSALLRHVIHAEAAGFASSSSSDHLMPWSEQQGHAGHVWSFLGAAMQATSLPMGCVTTPGWRYHPAILAQAMATLAELYPQRLFVCFGSGEAVNERVVGRGWPAKPARQAVLRESVGIIRALLAGETVDHVGEHVVVEHAKLYTRPATAPLLIGAALTPETARFVGGFCDGVITVNQSPEQLRRLLDAFREGGGEGKPAYLQVHLAWGRSDDEARHEAFERWRTVSVGGAVLAELSRVDHFESAARFVRPEDMDGNVRISADLQRHIAWLQQDIALGFEQVFLHAVGADQTAFIDAFGDVVLPALRHDLRLPVGGS